VETNSLSKAMKWPEKLNS